MIEASELYNFFKGIGIDFFTGVPDSTLKNFLDYLVEKESYGKTHIVASNEGNSVGLASGYYISTQKKALVYMQNSGIGNAVNPITSLTEIFKIPVIYLIGWRGKSGIKDEPQHKKMGEITEKILELLDISTFNIDDTTELEDMKKYYENVFKSKLNEGKSVAFVVSPKSIQKSIDVKYENENSILREEIIKEIVKIQDENDVIISTTGKTSRELFEIREFYNQLHNKDFLTVGSMGHTSMIASAIACNSSRRIWCLDGDGAALMHLGALTTIGKLKPKNLIHILLNNESHESVGGIATVANDIDWKNLVSSINYKNYFLVKDLNEANEILKNAKQIEGPTFIEIKVKIASRENLGRPTKMPQENIQQFMRFVLGEINESNNI